MAEQTQKRVLPQSELDFYLMTTDSVWGKDEISNDLKTKLTKYFSETGEDGEQKITYDSLWGLLGFYTRDMRLANLSEWNGEIQYAQYYLNLANDLLHAEMVEPFLIALSRVATLLELSQSKRGFLRRQMHTLRTEHMQGEIEPKKKKLFGGADNKKMGGGY